MAPAEPQECEHHLMDVLEMLPLDVIQTNVWAQLVGPHVDVCRPPDTECWQPDEPDTTQPSTDCSSFKLTCRRSAQLVDELITSITYSVGGPSEGPAHSVEGVDAPGVGADVPSSSHATQRSRAAFLARLPRLTALKLNSWSSEEALLDELQQCVSATGGRVSRLALSGNPVLHEESMAAVRQACPGLRKLLLKQWGDNEAHWSSGKLFEPLYGAGLTKLCMTVIDEDPHEHMLRSLGSLATLQHLFLVLNADPMEEYRHLVHLSGLHSLTHCDITAPHHMFYGAHSIAPLLAATQLTSLKLWGLYAFDATSRPAVAARLAEAYARMGALTRLRSLDLGGHFVAGDMEFDALRCLTLLTELHVGGLLLKSPTPGHLPALRRLGLCAVGVLQRPSRLLHSLLPLLPLRCLEDFNAGFAWQPPFPGLRVFAGHEGGDDALAEAAALRRVAQALAAAPLLRLSHPVVYGACCGKGELTQAQINDSLQPLSERFPGTTFERVKLSCKCGTEEAAGEAAEEGAEEGAED